MFLNKFKLSFGSVLYTYMHFWFGVCFEFLFCSVICYSYLLVGCVWLYSVVRFFVCSFGLLNMLYESPRR